MAGRIFALSFPGLPYLRARGRPRCGGDGLRHQLALRRYVYGISVSSPAKCSSTFFPSCFVMSRTILGKREKSCRTGTIRKSMARNLEGGNGLVKLLDDFGKLFPGWFPLDTRFDKGGRGWFLWSAVSPTD